MKIEKEEEEAEENVGSLERHAEDHHKELFTYIFIWHMHAYMYIQMYVRR